jgi:putative ABC transport system permease protein
MALGARPGDVQKMVITQGMRLALVGIVIGLAAAFAVTRLMNALLYEVRATDPTSYLGMTLLLCAVAALACWIPSRRAARVDPLLALRSE